MRSRTNRLTDFLGNRMLGLAVAMALLASLSAACGSSDDSADDPSANTGDAAADQTTGTSTDDTEPGSDDESSDRARRIVSISPTATESLFAIGAGDQVVAVDSLSNYPPEAPVTDLSAFEPNLEAIASEDPDLVVLSYDPGGVVSGLEAAGIETLLQPPAASLDDVYAQIADLGLVTGEVDGAADLVAEMRRSIDAIVAAAPVTDTPIRLYHEVDETFYSASSNSFVGQLYALLGVENIADEADADGSGFPQLSPEYILEADPQLIVIPDQVSYTAADVAARPGWEVLSAVQNDAVVVVDADIASRWGPRVVDFLEFVSGALTALVVGA